MATASKMLTAIASAMAKGALVIAPVAKFAAETGKNVVEESVKDLVLTSSSPLPSGSDSSSDYSKDDFKARPGKKQSSRRKEKSSSSHKGTWSMKGFLADSPDSSGSSATSEVVNDGVPKL